MANLRDVFHQQKLFFSSEKTRDLSFRLEQLAILKKMIIQNQQQIIAAIQRDFKKPEHEILSSEIGVVIDEIKLFQNKLQSWLKPIKRVTPLPFLFADSQIYLEPRGISLIIAPWNYPFQLCFAPLVGAVAAGQCVMMKPSEVSSHTTKLIFELVSKTFSSDYIAVIEGGVTETTELLKLPFDHIFFTGSTEVGRIVQRAAAENLVPTVLELGGKSPAIVTQKADLDVAVQKLAWGKFFNAGQTCVAPDYVYVHSDIYDRFLNLFKDKLIQFYGAQPELSTSFARIINDRHFERLAELIAAEKVFYGGKTISKDRYIDPTLLKELKWDDPVMKQEINGPILPVMKFSSLTDLLNL
ncbi:MAG: aldehyde dehydrogenase family protein, partial [Pseudobdellovibrionaceae bacterium]